MKNYNKFLVLWSIFGFVLFYTNTYLIKFLFRDFFYMFGFYSPSILVVYYLGYLIYFKVNIKTVYQKLIIYNQ